MKSVALSGIYAIIGWYDFNMSYILPICEEIHLLKMKTIALTIKKGNKQQAVLINDDHSQYTMK